MMSELFNEICINEEMQPKDIHIYTHTHTHTYIYMYIYIYIAAFTNSKQFSEKKAFM